MSDPVRDGIRCMLMRGGTSKGAYFLAEDLPGDPAERDDLLLRVMGSPDPAQIDGLGGAHPLTSKVAIVSPSSEPTIDIDYLFLQVAVDQPLVGHAQTCGNLLAGIGPFAVERGLIAAGPETTTVRIRLVNTGDLATQTFATPDGRVDYDGTHSDGAHSDGAHSDGAHSDGAHSDGAHSDGAHSDGATSIDGVPGTAARIDIEMAPAAGARLLPTGNLADDIDGHRVTLIDNGMPVVLLRADEFGVAGDENPADLEENAELIEAIEAIRRAAGPMMGLGEVSDATVPKMFLLSAPRHGGAIATRAFIPRRVHTSIGVLMAASVAAGVCIPGTVGADLANPPDDGPVDIEHPSGIFPSLVSVGRSVDGTWHATSTSVRTARKIFDGVVFPRPRL